jgi:hypothetical protein
VIKLIEIYNELKEAKQVGTVYHFASLPNLIKILKENRLRASDKIQKYISLTRDKNFYKNSDTRTIWGVDTEVRIVINGDLLSTKYKIEPYNFFSSRKKMNIPDKIEYEERVVAPVITDLDRYVISYDILFVNAMGENSDYDELADEAMSLNSKVKEIKPKGI